MIGFQDSVAVASQHHKQQQPASSQSNQINTSPRTGATGERSSDNQRSQMDSPREPDGQHLAQISQQQHCHNNQATHHLASQQHQRLSLLTSQNQSRGQEEAQGRAHASSSSPSPTSGHHHNLLHNHHQKSSPAGRRVSSPGYHSAASSPGSSISSLVSSSASSASSSGVSSASSDHHNNQQQQRPATIPSPTCSMSTSSSAGSIMLTPTTTIASALNQNQISHHNHHHHLGQHHHGDEDHQGSQSGLGSGSGGAAARLANSTPPQIAISAAGFPSVPHLSSHQDQPQPHLRQSQSHLSHHRANSQTHLQQQQQLNNGCNQPNLLDYYPEAQQDGLNLSWFHGANSRQALVRALASERAIVTGDISLAELSRYPVPIMARPPLGVSDLTLENWLTDVIQARKGIKLTFTSTRTVEPAFRVLARHAEHLKGPIILSADILARPVAGSGASGKLSGGGGAAAASKQQQQQQQQQPVDAWTFLMLCRTRFPRSIISIGWCPATAGATSSQQPQISAIEPIVQQADSSTTAESMFELDMMLDQQQQQQPSTGGGHHFSQPLLHLSPAAFNQRSSLGSLSVVQQLAAVAAAAGANNHHHDQANYHHRLGAPTNGAGNAHQMNPANRNPQHSYILSSTGSLNSSSGNSSGSPSPTSPIGHHLLMSPAHQQQLQQQQQAQLISQHHHQQVQRHLHQMHQGHHQQHHHYLHHQSSSAEQLMLAAAAAAAAAASENNNNNNKSNSSLASIKVQQQQHQSNQQQQQQVVGWPAVAAMVAASASFKHEDEETEEREHDDEVEDEPEDGDDDDGQLPLNLNINEADPQHASSTLNELAQKIKSLQQESNDLNSITSSLSGGQSTAAFSLASKLFAVGNHLSMGPSGDQGKWEHISKKAALANRLNSNSPSPVSTSPKYQQQHGYHQNNLLCVKATTSLANLAAAQQQQHQHKLVVKQEPRQQQQQMQSGHQHHHHNNQQQLGYTREMIDKMASLVKEYNLTQPITFPVEARLLGRNNNSLAELQRLLYQVGTNSTLTIVAQPEDLISVDDLLTIRKHFATNQILFDLPDELTASLRHELELL